MAKKQVPQYLIFRCGMTHFDFSYKKSGRTFILQKELLKTEMIHNEIDLNNWRDKPSEWLDYVKNDVSCTAFSYARYNKAMEETIGLLTKHCLSLPALGWKHFDSLGTEEDESIYTYNDNYMRRFLRQSTKRGRVCAFYQYYESKVRDDKLKIISEELNVNDIIYDILEARLNYKNDPLGLFGKDYESIIHDYRNEDIVEKEIFVNKKLGQFPVHQLLKQMKLH